MLYDTTDTLALLTNSAKNAAAEHLNFKFKTKEPEIK